jgi:hypothetical protein
MVADAHRGFLFTAAGPLGLEVDTVSGDPRR